MAIMYPKNITEYMPEESERIVYQELKKQLPDSFEVFYSVKWTTYKHGKLLKSEADFIVVSPDYGFLCLEVKGGNQIRRENNIWYLRDSFHGERRLNCSPYDQAEKSMYYFEGLYSNMYHIRYPGIYAAGVIFPFYVVPDDLKLDNRHRHCTIDSHDLNHLYDGIKKMFRLWGGTSYGLRVYGISHHQAFVELIRDRIAISAAAGALVKYKEQQLQVINRVQDNYIYFLNNVKRFYIKGGAGTGKTWIARKMAMLESQNQGRKVLFLCASSNLSKMISENMPENVDVMNVPQLFAQICSNFDRYTAPMYEGIIQGISNYPTYDAIFIDEAQDFNEEWAQIVCRLLKDDTSRLGVFYDEVQILREHSFKNAFEISGYPYLLRENIRNTANIYSWTAKKTNLGQDEIINPVEGPTPKTEYINDRYQLTHRLETLFRKYIEEEHLPNASLVVIVDNVEEFLSDYQQGLAKWTFVHELSDDAMQIQVASVEKYKGLEADMVIYIHREDTTNNMDYIAYTRAKYYLIELVRRY